MGKGHQSFCQFVHLHGTHYSIINSNDPGEMKIVKLRQKLEDILLTCAMSVGSEKRMLEVQIHTDENNSIVETRIAESGPVVFTRMNL